MAVCGSGVGACVAANKVAGVRACLIGDVFSARQGVEDDNLNVICLGGRVLGDALAWELLKTFLDARFSGAERHCRRLAKIAKLEKGQAMGDPALLSNSMYCFLPTELEGFTSLAELALDVALVVEPRRRRNLAAARTVALGVHPQSLGRAADRLARTADEDAGRALRS